MNLKLTQHNQRQRFRRVFSVIFLSVASFFSSTLLASQPVPCSDENYRQFDFWIGDWQVKDSQDKVVGENRIFKILNGCALSENWTGAAGNPGVSYNFYDRAEKKWHQTWVDQSGGALYLNGGLTEGKMVLTGTRPDKQGKSILHRITWTPLGDGRVKQHWQSSADNGKTWVDVFVGFYQKKT